MALDVQELQGQWQDLRGLVQRRWKQLSDSDLRVVGENLSELVDFIEHKTGEGRDSIELFLSVMTSGGASAVSHAARTVGRYTREGLDRTERATRRRPGRAVAVAFGFGLVAGLLVGRSLRR